MHALWLLCIVALPGASVALELECPVSRKVTAHGVVSDEDLRRWRFTVRIEETPDGAFLSRCAREPGGEELECRRLRVDRVALDRRIGAKKYYLFRPLYDVQLFRDNRFVESNGRGAVSFGTCTLVSP